MKATVLIPTHDHGPTIRHSVVSALTQTVKDIEIFIVGDGTTVRVSESGRSGLRVRILDGSQKGRVGWVPFDWVKPLPNSN